MANPGFPSNRRAVLAGLGAAALCPAIPAIGVAQAGTPLALQAKADRIALRGGSAETAIWSLGGSDLRLKRGEILDVAFGNELPAPVMLAWRGIDGAAAAEPLIARAPLAAGTRETFQVPLRHAGTFLCDPTPVAVGDLKPTRPRALIVGEASPVAVDRDEVFLIEEWRLAPDGAAIAPGAEVKDAISFFTVNGKTSFDLSASPRQRLRIRFINASQRTVLAIKLGNHDVRVMAIDGEPAEPFAARSGALVLAPQGRADAFIDAVMPASFLLHDGATSRPVGKLTISGDPFRAVPLPPAPALPSNGLPAQLDLKNAQRVDLSLGTTADWVRAADFKGSAPPAFQAKSGRPVVLALSNRAPVTHVLHLHGHHFRLLDRLDDGWKPYWLDTLAVEPGQTQRIAFLAEHAGRYLIESVATDWAAPRLVRWYSVA